MNAQIFGTEALCKRPLETGYIQKLYKNLSQILERSEYPARTVSEQFDEIAHILYYVFYE